jgi:hypothetical protein
MTRSQKLLREIDEAAAGPSLSRQDLLRAAVRTFLDHEWQWQEIQDEVSQKSRDAGIMNEEDNEESLDRIKY